MARRDVVVIGASAGGVEALRALVAGLPPDFPAALLVVLHLPANARSALPEILSRSGPLPAVQAYEDAEVLPGRILVAPPDRHLLVYDGHVTLSRGPRENGHRPSVDVLFRSAARARGARVVGVILSGTLDDGAAGMVAVHRTGGVGIVQDPEDAAYDSMPLSALEADHPLEQVPAHRMGDALLRLVTEDLPEDPLEDIDGPAPEVLIDEEVAVAGMDGGTLNKAERPGEPSGFACPDCHGVLFEIEEGHLRRFRCRVGHAWSAGSLAAQQTSAVEGALWSALRALEEKAALAERMHDSAHTRGHTLTASTFASHAAESRRAALIIRDLIEQTAALVVDTPVEAPAPRLGT